MAALATDSAESMPFHVEPLWIEPARSGATEAAHRVPGLLAVPPGWAPGAPAAVVVAEHSGPEEWRNWLVAALLEEGVAVLEIDPHTGRGIASDNAVVAPPPNASALLPDLFGALAAQRGETLNAGAVVVFGRSGAAGGEAALLALEAPLRSVPEGPGFTAAATVGWGQFAAEGCFTIPGVTEGMSESVSWRLPGAMEHPQPLAAWIRTGGGFRCAPRKVPD